MDLYRLHENIQLPLYFNKGVPRKKILIFRGPSHLKYSAMQNINIII